jgi:SGNH hydrolase-like domain, acetyltransferase AlgX
MSLIAEKGRGTFAADSPPSRWSIGRLVPLALLLWCLFDLGLRFLPEDWLRIEPVQVATRLPERYSPFTANLRLRVLDGVGEQALMGNLAPTEVLPPMYFTTDANGFRATPQPNDGAPQVFVFKGDSFTFGGSLSDEDTFPAALARQLGVAVYNAGRFFTDDDGVKDLDHLIRRSGGERVTVVCIYLESHENRFLSSYASDAGKTALTGGLAGRAGTSLLGAEKYIAARQYLHYLERRYGAWWRISPLKIASIRAYKRFYDGRFLPNESRGRVEIRQLPNGQRILLNPEKVRSDESQLDPRLVRRTVEYFDWMNKFYQQRRVDFVALLLPDKETVYGPQLSLPAAGSSFLDSLEKELTSRNIRTLNALTVLRRTADEDWMTGKLSYYREDHHWNPRGVERVATALADTMRGSGSQLAGTTHVVSAGKVESGSE